MSTSPAVTTPSRALPRLAGWLAESPVFRHGQKLWQQNRESWNLPLSPFDKLHAGGYLILRDYAASLFPPRFKDRSLAYQGEIDYGSTLPGTSLAEVNLVEMRKPFWFEPIAHEVGMDKSKLIAQMRECGLSEIVDLGPRWHGLVKPHWLLGRKAG